MKRVAYLSLLLVVLVATSASAQKKARSRPATSKSAKAKASATPTDWSSVEKAFGRHGTPQADDVIRFSFPRTDLNPMVQGVQIRPAFALGSWIAMVPTKDGGAMAMGDLVLSEDEVEDVIDRLRQGGVDPVAIHHHLMLDVPPVKYVHISAHGDPLAIAKTVRAALETTRTPLDTTGAGTPIGLIDLDTAAIARALGRTGKAGGGVYSVSVPRPETIRDGKTVIPPSMGVSTVLNFQPTGAGRAAVTGDFVLIASEVAPVMSALRKAGIDVTSLHSHMLTEEPRLFFMHFWAHDDTEKLARGLRSALDAIGRSSPR